MLSDCQDCHRYERYGRFTTLFLFKGVVESIRDSELFTSVSQWLSGFSSTSRGKMAVLLRLEDRIHGEPH